MPAVRALLHQRKRGVFSLRDGCGHRTLKSGGAGGDAMNTFCQGCGMPMKKDPEIGADAKPYQERDTAKALLESRS